MPINNALTPEGQNALGAAFGYYPQLRRNRTMQDPRLAAEMPLQFLRGRLAGTLGLPSDVANLVRSPMPMEMYGDVDYAQQAQVPYGSQELLRTLPLPPQGPAQAAAANVGAVVPLTPMEALQAARAARQAALAGGKALGPTAARNEAGAFNLYHGGELVKTPTPDKQGLFTDGVPGVSFTPNIVEAARYAKHNMGNINAIDASSLKIYQGGEKALDAAYKAGNFSAIKRAGFDGVKLQHSSEYVLFDPEKVFSLPRKVAEQNVNRKVGGDMRQFLDWKDVGN